MTTRTILALLALAAVAFVPVAANAQSYDDIILNHSYNPNGKNQKRSAEDNANSIYGDTQNNAEAMGGGDVNEPSDMGDDSQESYDQQAVGEGAAQDIYGYISGQTKMSPTERRNADAKKANDAAMKTRAAALKKMQDNSNRLVKQQKERAWKLAHPGQEYPGEDAEDGDGAQETAYNAGDGDNADDDQQQEEENAQDDEENEQDSSNGAGY